MGRKRCQISEAGVRKYDLGASKFDELACYTPHLVNTKECKARRFKKWLRPKLYNAIVVLRLSTYADVLQ